MGSRDGTGPDALFYKPAGIVTDPAGNVFVVDEGNHTIRRITPAGQVTTFAGAAGSAGGADGIGSAARFNSPQGIAADSAGNLFVADTDNHAIRKITPAGVVTTLAGLAGEAGSADGTGGAARFSRPRGIAVDSAGTVYVTDPGNRRIRKITADGVVTSLPGNYQFPEPADFGVSRPVAYGAIAVDPAGNLFVSRFLLVDEFNDYGDWMDYFTVYYGSVTRIAPDGAASDLWYTSLLCYFDGRVDGVRVAGIAFDPAGQLTTSDHPLAIDRAGNRYETDSADNVVRRTSPAGVAATLAGFAVSAATGTADGAGAAARFTSPQGVAVDSAGNSFVTDYGSHCVRKITPAGVVTTLAGQPGTPGSADGTGTAAQFNHPLGIAIDRAGFLYIADCGNDTIRKISPTGDTTTLAGTAGLPGFDDGQGPAARIWNPLGVAVDATGNVYVTCMATVRKITPSGLTTTLAGKDAEIGSVDGAGTDARFIVPYGITVDAAGNLYVTEAPYGPYIARVRRITPAGEVSTIAGSDHGSADGVGIAAGFHAPEGIAVDAAGNLFIADSLNQTIRRVAPDGTVSTLAGLADGPGNADGAGRDARFYYPPGIAVDAAGNLYVTSGTTVRKGRPASAPQIADQPRSQAVTAGASVIFTVSAGGLPAPTYQWCFNGSAIAGATDTTLSLPGVRASDAGNYTVVVANALGSVTSTPAVLTVTAAGTTPPPGTGGGGAVSAWFLLALLALGAVRRLRAAPARSRP